MGMVDQLKTETKTSLRGADDGRTVKLYDLVRTEGNLNVRMTNIGGRQSWKRVDQKIDSMSLTRVVDDTYEMRFDVNLKEFRRAGDLTATLNGTTRPSLNRSNSLWKTFKSTLLFLSPSTVKNVAKLKRTSAYEASSVN